jgi:predicted nuclease of predicted toxin-antitoxin system
VALRLAGHDVTWVRVDHPGAKDAWLLEFAEAESWVLVTLDKDFCSSQFNGTVCSTGAV